MLQVTLMQIPLQQSWCVKSNVGFSSSDWVCDHTLNNIASVQQCFIKCGKMSQISGSLTTGASLSEYNTDHMLTRAWCTYINFLHRTAISAIKVMFLLNRSEVEVCGGSGSCDNMCKGSIHALFPLYLACSRSWTMCSCPLDLAIDRGVPHCVKRQWS